MNDIMAFNKDGSESSKRWKYKVQLVAERMVDYAADHYVSKAMERGIDLEPDARMAYETRTGNLCGPAALITHPRIESFAATPDGTVGDDGLIEIKVPLVHNYLEWMIAGDIPEQHFEQMAAQLACTGREYVDFVAFCPEMPPPKNLFIKRFRIVPSWIAKVEAAAIKFLDETETLFHKVAESGILANLPGDNLNPPNGGLNGNAT